MTTLTTAAPTMNELAAPASTKPRRSRATLAAALLALAASAFSLFLWLTNIYGYGEDAASVTNA